MLFKSSLRDLFAIDGNVPNQQQQLAATPFIPPPTKEEYRQEETKIPDEEQKLSQKQLEEVGGYADDFFSIFVCSCSLSSSFCKQKKTMMLKQPKWPELKWLQTWLSLMNSSVLKTSQLPMIMM